MGTRSQLKYSYGIYRALTFHKRQDKQELLEKYGHRIVWLPPYSPDLNPVEKMWA
ncbi:transposase [Acinetobacter geminorum]|uniref:transposase n=1 Tax=Acinetobacter geminorum TaxID=2730922 RepID=UPI003AF5EB36